MRPLQPGDPLPPEYHEQAIRAVAILKAQLAALRAGMSLVDVEGHEWIVDLDADDAEVA